MKCKIKKATISDKIRFKSKDIVDSTVQQLSDRAFTYSVEEDLYSILSYNEESDICEVPSGTWYKLDIENLIDKRFVSDKLDISCNIELKPKQRAVTEKMLQGDKLYSGLIQAPCGFGKSYVGSYLIGNHKKSTLIICHTKLLAYQWLEVLKSTISGTEIGFMGDGKKRIKPITVGIYKTLIKHLPDLQNKFEVIIVDEAHLCMADTFTKVVNGINAKTKISLTATPFRKDGLHILFPDYFGPNKVIAADEDKIDPEVKIIKTGISFGIKKDPKLEWSRLVTKLTGSETYQNLIVERARRYIMDSRCILILADRVDMLKALNEKIERSALLVGSTDKEQREDILENAGTRYDVILSTNIFDEGISCHRLDTLFLTCPNNNLSKLEQRIGRIQREHPYKQSPLLVDFWFNGIVISKQQFNRLQWYKKQKFIIR